MTNIKKQAGVAIIVCIMVLLVISLIMGASVRHGMSSQLQSTRAVAQIVLQNEVDVALMAAVGFAVPNDTAATSMFKVAKESPGNEIVFCTTANMKTAYFPIDNYNIYSWTSGSSIALSYGSKGYCKPSDESSYVNNRDIYLTQIAVRYADHLNIENFTKGVWKNGSIYVITATSFLPKMGISGVSMSAIESCLSGHMNDSEAIRHPGGSDEARKTVAECLNGLGIPAISNSRTVIIPVQGGQ